MGQEYPTNAPGRPVPQLSPWSPVPEGLRTDVHLVEPSLEPFPLVSKSGFCPPGSPSHPPWLFSKWGTRASLVCAVPEGRGVWLAALGLSAPGNTAPSLLSPWGFQLGNEPWTVGSRLGSCPVSALRMVHVCQQWEGLLVVGRTSCYI